MIAKSDHRRILAFQREKEIPERLPVSVAVIGGLVVIFLLFLIGSS